jgi:hypothetical protein
MTTTIQFDVTVEKHEPSGAFVARSAEFSSKIGIGLTEDESVADLRAHVLRPAPQPLRPPHPATPWYLSAPPLPDDELTAEWKRILQERRTRTTTSEPESIGCIPADRSGW